MLTTRKILSDIRNIATSGSNSVDFRIEDSQILHWINQTRSMLIAQQLQKRNDISDSWLQSISCLKLIDVDKSECCEIVTNCSILRTEKQLPSTIDNDKDNLIIRVESSNGNIISKTNPFEDKYSSYNKYSKNKSKWFVKNDYIYISNEVYIDNINIWGLFEEPSDLADFVTCDGSSCFNIDDRYQCGMKMASDIVNIVLKTKVLPYIQMPEDNTNDSSNEMKINSKN